MTRPTPSIARRKLDHLELAASGEVEFHRSTLLEEVHLVHQSLPERRLDDVDLSATLAGRTLAAPLVVSGMTGGAEEARAINRDLARAADQLGIGFGVGSQRAMAEHADLADTYQVRDVAPGLFLLGNLGVVQARALGAARVAELARAIDANAMAIHLNPAQELVQDGGDRDFTGCIEILRDLARELTIPVIVKETGCGLSPEAASSISAAGIATVDVSGAGGTSWVAVEARRAAPAQTARALGEELWDWGIPTAVSVAACAQRGLAVIATGGLRTGLDVARALALGATCGGMAAPVLRAHRAGGFNGAIDFLTRVIASLRATVLLAGCGRAQDLARAPRHLGPTLSSWLADLGLHNH